MSICTVVSELLKPIKGQQNKSPGKMTRLLIGSCLLFLSERGCSQLICEQKAKVRPWGRERAISQREHTRVLWLAPALRALLLGVSAPAGPLASGIVHSSAQGVVSLLCLTVKGLLLVIYGSWTPFPLSFLPWHETSPRNSLQHCRQHAQPPFGILGEILIS